MKSIRRFVRPAMLVAAMLLVGCETQPLLKSEGLASLLGPLGVPATVLALDAPLPPTPARQWPDLTLDVDSYRVAGWGLVSMPTLQTYLNRLYATVKTTSGYPNWPGSVYILADPALRATSTSAGNIFISLGWVRSIESEDEIFALLSHEFSHVYLNHHAGTDVGNAAQTVTQLAAAAWMIANRNVQSTAMNGAYVIAGVQMLGSGVAMPAWQRFQEEEADRLGAAISLRNGYSYSQGFKLFLEHIDSYDTTQQAQAEIREKASFDAMRKAAGQAAAEQARRDQGNVKDVSGLGKTSSDLRVKLAEESTDVQTAFKQAVDRFKAKVTDNHDSAASREDTLSKAIAPLLVGKPRPTARSEAWKSTLKQRDTTVLLDHYALFPAIDEAIAAKRLPEALQLANTAASGATANDALPLYYLQTVTGLMRPGQMVPDLPRRHLRASERSWKLELLIASSLARRDRLGGKVLIEEQFLYFHKAPPAWPELIAFYRDNGFNTEAKSMAQECSAKMPSYRTACVQSAKTESEQQAEKAASEREGKRLSDKLIKNR